MLSSYGGHRGRQVVMGGEDEIVVAYVGKDGNGAKSGGCVRLLVGRW